jgi:hypothetical protein
LPSGSDQYELAAPIVQKHDGGLLGPEEIDSRGNDRLDGIGQRRGGRSDLAHLERGLEGPFQFRGIPDLDLRGTRE